MKIVSSLRRVAFAVGVRPKCVLTLCLVSLLSSSCSLSNDEQLAQHVSRGNQYVEQHKFAEAVIEYKNAARAAPNDVSVHWKLAQTALKTKDFQTAIPALQRTIALDPTHYEAKDALGGIYFAAGRTQEAHQTADDLVTQHSKRPAGYLLQGRLAAREGDVSSAIRRFKEALDRDPQNDEITVAVGHLYLLQHNAAEALIWYDKALQAHPDSIEALVARGNYYFGAGRREDGEQDYRKAAELAKGSEETRLSIAVQHLTHGRPQHAEQELTAVADALQSQQAQLLLAELKLELGKISEAKPLVAALAKDQKQDAGIAYLQGRIALAEQRRDEARGLLEAAGKREPGMAAVHLYLGVLDLLEGRRAKGEERLLDAVKLDPADAKAHLVLAELYLNENSFAKAEQEAFEVLRRNPAHLQAAVLYGDSFLLRDDWGKAEAIYSALLKQLPDSPIGPTKMAILKRRQGFTAQAADFFAEAVKRGPNDPGLMAEHLLALVAAEKTSKAEQVLKDYLAKGSKDPWRWQVAGRFHLAAGHVTKAEEALKKVVELAPHDVGSLYQLAQFYIGQKQSEAAEAALRKVINMDEKAEAAHTSLGLLLATQGRTDEANDHYRRALELRPTNYVAANNLAANLLEQHANLDEALRYGKLALEAAPASPFVQDTVGWIYFKKGSLDEANRLLSSAASQLTDNPLVRYHHAMMLAQRGERALAESELEAALALSKTFPGAAEAAMTLASLRE
jgi:tetratricopeptide (TPR) repeat protein